MNSSLCHGHQQLFLKAVLGQKADTYLVVLSPATQSARVNLILRVFCIGVLREGLQTQVHRYLKVEFAKGLLSDEIVFQTVKNGWQDQCRSCVTRCH